MFQFSEENPVHVFQSGRLQALLGEMQKRREEKGTLEAGRLAEIKESARALAWQRAVQASH